MCDKDVNQKLQDSLKRSIAIYSRVIGKKASVEGANNTSITLRDKVANFFARESTEVLTDHVQCVLLSIYNTNEIL